MKSQPQIDRHFLALAYEYAKKFSSDPRTQNGAVIINSQSTEILGYGANRFPDGVRNLTERLHPDHKRNYLEHAERDAIFAALRSNRSTQGATMYVPWFACTDCAKAIIGAGIKCVVGHLAPCSTASTWSSSIDIGLTMLTEANVKFRYYDGEVGVKALRFADKIIDR